MKLNEVQRDSVCDVGLSWWRPGWTNQLSAPPPRALYEIDVLRMWRELFRAVGSSRFDSNMNVLQSTAQTSAAALEKKEKLREAVANY